MKNKATIVIVVFMIVIAIILMIAALRTPQARFTTPASNSTSSQP